MNILQINSSARRLQDDQGSVSTRLANELTAGLRATHPDASLVVRDFAVSPLPVLDEAALGALFTPADARTPEQAARVALNDQLIAELFAADVIVLGVPMINFNVSAQLKNWIDAVARAGVTFKYGPTGPVGRGCCSSPGGGGIGRSAGWADGGGGNPPSSHCAPCSLYAPINACMDKTFM